MDNPSKLYCTCKVVYKQGGTQGCNYYRVTKCTKDDEAKKLACEIDGHNVVEANRILYNKFGKRGRDKRTMSIVDFLEAMEE